MNCLIKYIWNIISVCHLTQLTFIDSIYCHEAIYCVACEVSSGILPQNRKLPWSYVTNIVRPTAEFRNNGYPHPYRGRSTPVFLTRDWHVCDYILLYKTPIFKHFNFTFLHCNCKMKRPRTRATGEQLPNYLEINVVGHLPYK